MKAENGSGQMTREEAILIFQDIILSDCYFQCSDIKDHGNAYDIIYGQHRLEVVNFMLDRIMEMPMSFKDAQRFFDDCADYATMDNERTGDEFDNIIFFNNDIAICTEVLGRTYSASKFGKTWKFYDRPKTDKTFGIFDEEWKRIMEEAFDKYLPKLEANDISEVKPMSKIRSEMIKDD